MEGQVVIVHDRRLAGSPPTRNTLVVEVDQNTLLDAMVKRVKNISFQFGSEIRLRILAHGYEDADGHGGYGIQLCKEDLTLKTVNQLAPWNGCLSYGMVIYSCGTADVAPGRAGTLGDGRMLCSRIASVTGTGVRAADATQYYSNGFLGLGSIDFGAWEGNVLEFNARGTLVGIQHEPAD